LWQARAVIVEWTDPTTAETWIRVARLVAVPVVAAQAALARLQNPEFEPRDTLAACVFLLLLELVELAFYRVRQRHLLPAFVHLLTDLAFLACATYFLGGLGTPALDLLVLFAVPASLGLTRPLQWVIALVLMVFHNVAVLSLARPPFGLAPSPELWLSIRQMLVFDVAALTLTGFVSNVRSVLEDGQSRLQQALDDHNRNDRLMALGVMAAGIAHELGTPLSSIDLLASEVEAEPEEAPELLATLRGQVQRCREILDRIRGSTSHTVSNEVEDFGASLRRWLADWQNAGSDRQDLTLELPPEVRHLAVQGDADTWRGIVWSLMDNALRAGGPLTVRVRLEEPGLHLDIDDAGPGPTDAALAMAGKPFYTSWNDTRGPGRGLGLFVARSFARRWSGDVSLSRRKPSGGRVTIRFATLQEPGR
jgi:two-component system, sensor histidine kinase RegB